MADTQDFDGSTEDGDINRVETTVDDFPSET